MSENPSPLPIDPVAARRWQARRPEATPWLHEEVARRMAERLGWIRLPVQDWALWEPEHAGRLARDLVARHHPSSRCMEVHDVPAPAASTATEKRWWQRLGRKTEAGVVSAETLAESSVQLLWANMLAHHEPDPRALIERWHRTLTVGGFLMFSCLGPDTLRELRAVYQALGWTPPAHEFTDMHDWGDRLLTAGFGDPVMDMEYITLSFDTPARLLQELRELGRNLHPQRHAGWRTPRWQQRLEQALDTQLRPQSGGPLTLSFELVYGHAVKPEPRQPISISARRRA